MITDWHQIAAVLTGVIAIVAVVPYVRDMLRGTTRPNIVSWGLWTLIHIIFIAAQWSSGASWSIVLPATELFTVALVVVLAAVGYGYKKYTPLDLVCFCLAIAAIVLWQVTSEPMVALLMSVGADIMASIPTLKKAYLDPTSETLSTYILVVISAIFAALSTTIFDVPNLVWPAYIFLVNGSILCLILLGRRAQKGPISRA